MKNRKNLVIENSSKMPRNKDKAFLISYKNILVEKIFFYKKISKCY